MLPERTDGRAPAPTVHALAVPKPRLGAPGNAWARRRRPLRTGHGPGCNVGSRHSPPSARPRDPTTGTVVGQTEHPAQCTLHDATIVGAL